MNTASFFKDLEFSDEKVIIKSLIDSKFSKEIRIAFKQNQVMKEHKTKFPITVMILQGSIAFSIDRQTTILNQGDMIALEGNIMHELKALEQSVVRLSLHKSDSIERVKKLIKS